MMAKQRFELRLRCAFVGAEADAKNDHAFETDLPHRAGKADPHGHPVLDGLVEVGHPGELVRQREIPGRIHPYLVVRTGGRIRADHNR